MQLPEIVYRILKDGMGCLDSIFKDLEEWRAFLAHFLGTEVLRHVWYLPRSGGVNSRRALRGHVAADPSDSATTAPPKVREQGPAEYASLVAFAHFSDTLLRKLLKKALLRRAERRVAKNVVSRAKKESTDKSRTSWESGLTSAERGQLKEVLRAGFGAAEKALDTTECREAEKAAQQDALEVLWEFLSQRPREPRMIEETISAALERGMDTLPEGDSENDQQLRAAVAATLENWLSTIECRLKKSVLPLTDIRELQRLAKWRPSTEGEDHGTGELVSAAFLHGARKVMSAHGLPAHGPIRDAVEARLNDFRHRLTESLADPNRVGKHAANFLKSEVSRVKKRALHRARRVPINDPGERIVRQVKARLRKLRDAGVVISRRQPGQRELYWGRPEWKPDEDRWARSTSVVDEAALAAKLPEFGGKAETSGLIDYARLDSFLPDMLRHHGRWLMTKHFCNVVKLKTTVPFTREEGTAETEGEGWRDPIIDVADPRSLQFTRDLEVNDILDKEPMSKGLREYWTAVKRYPDDYPLALQELKAKGWNDEKIAKCKKTLLSMKRAATARVIQ